MKKAILISVFCAVSLFAQNASDYFPSAQGFKWYFRNTPFDTLNHPVDSLSVYQIDSFATTVNYKGKFAHVVLSKMGTAESILQLPYIDTGYVHTENSNIWNYFTGLGDEFSGFGFDIADWFSVYRLNASTILSYTIFTKDTVISIDSTLYTLRIEVTGRRYNDQLYTTPYGTLNCKKFILKPTIKIIPPGLPIPIPILTLTDTVLIAPGYYVVKSSQPTVKLDLSLFGFPVIWIPGRLMDAIAPPPVLGVDSVQLSFPGHGDTTYVVVNNEGSGTLNWTAEILEGNEWLSFTEGSSGTGGDTLFVAAALNDTDAVRKGLIRVASEGAFNSPEFITVTQQEGVLVSTGEQNTHPGDYYLGQNYPNPFNPVTAIRFSVKEAGNVKLLVYDILGNLAASAADGYYSPGEYVVDFDAAGLASGVYFYRISVNGYSASRKMIIMK